MERGAAVRVVMTKWGDRPHWEFDARFLGEDTHGRWLGLRPGEVLSRPGRRLVTTNDQVVLVPRGDAGAGGAWVATLHGPGASSEPALGAPVAVYVDMTTPPTWPDGVDGPGARVTAVDLDLDVLRDDDGRVAVDDEDEFAEHRDAYGYPDAVVAQAEASCAWVQEEVRSQRPPFDDATRDTWLEVLAGLDATPGGAR